MSRPLSLLALLVGCGPLTNNPPLATPETPTSSSPATPGGTNVPEPLSCSELPEEAERILGNRCASCHGPTSPAYGDFGDVLDAVALVRDGWVEPIDPGSSLIMEQISAGSMPPPSGGGPLSDAEQDVIEQWIACGAEDWGTPATTRGFLSPEMEYQAARNDTAFLDVEDGTDPDQRNARYLSLVPLYNAGIGAEQIEVYGTALTKLVWSLTVERNVDPLVPVDLDGLELEDTTVVRVADGLGDKLLFRVDLKDFGWDNEGEAVDAWEELVKLYPFGIRYDEEYDPAGDLVSFTRTRVPIVHGDWFAANAALPPLYFDVLDMPHTLDGFMSKFGGIADFRANFDADAVDCAGFDGNQSLVSQQNRVTCRHFAIPSYCWQSFDFESVIDQDNIFGNPTDFLVAADGGEAFCSLFTGQQVYMAFDAAGQRVDDASTDLVTDFNPDAGAIVKTGLHCMRCHAAGLVAVEDQVLDSVLADPTVFAQEVVDQVELWYPEAGDWDDIETRDIDAFLDSLGEIGVDPGGVVEVTWQLSESYEAPLTVARVAADLGLPEGELLSRLASNDDIQVLYSPLFNGDELTRDVFELVARDTICGINAGDPCDFEAFCGLSSVPCPEGSTCDALGQCTKVE